jgi:nicotinamidase-related amidase
MSASGDPYTDPRFESAALITIDTQRDTLDGGSLEIAGTSAALPAIGVLLEAFRRRGRPIVHVVRLYEPGGGNVDLCRRSAVQAGARILLAGAPGTELAAELLPAGAPALDAPLLLGGAVQTLGPAEVAIYKPRWGAFFATPLEEHLRAHSVDTLVFCGCNFPNCPRTSMYEASERDFRVVLARDAISGLYERGEGELRDIGVHVMGAADVAAALAAAAGEGAVTGAPVEGGPPRPASAGGART